MNNYRHFGGGFLKLEQYREPHDVFLDLDKRQNLLAFWFSQVFLAFRNNGLTANGPNNFAELYQCPLTIRNYMNAPISVLQGHIHHQQFDFDNFPEIERPIQEAANARWSPIAESPDRNVEITLSVVLDEFAPAESALYMQTAGDRFNSATFLAAGVHIDSAKYYQFTGDPLEAETSSVEFDSQTRTCRGSHKNVAGSTAILYGQTPSQIHLRAASTWSIVRPHFRYVTVGSPARAIASLTATDLASQDDITLKSDTPLATLPGSVIVTALKPLEFQPHRLHHWELPVHHE